MLLGVPARDAFALELLMSRALPGWRCASALPEPAWPAADVYVLEGAAWTQRPDAPPQRALAPLAARAGVTPLVLIAPSLATREGAWWAAAGAAAGPRWKLLHRPFGAQAMSEALAWAGRAAAEPPDAAPAAAAPAPAVAAPDAPDRTAMRGAARAPASTPPRAADAAPPPPGASALFTSSVIGIGVDASPASPAAAPPPQIGEGELSLQAFRACVAQSPHPAARRALTRLADRLAAPGAFEIGLTLINGLLFDAERQQVASNTPLSVLRMVCRSRALTQHARLADLDPRVDVAQRAAQRGMQVHPLGAMLYALAQVTDCPLPPDDARP